MLERVTAGGGLVFFRSRSLHALGVPHGFSTRIGPGGRSDFTLAGGHPENTAAFATALGCGTRTVATVYQVHGACVWQGSAMPAEAPAVQAEDGRIQADAITSADPAQLLLVRTADCVPVLLASADGSRVAAIHAGWRGLVAGVIPNAAAALGQGVFTAAIGPCMGLGAFEVDEDVARAFDAAGMAAAVNRAAWPKPHVDLALAAQIQLRAAGANAVDAADLCTYRDEHWFFSHRRDRTHRGLPKTGHIAGAIGCK